VKKILRNFFSLSSSLSGFDETIVVVFRFTEITVNIERTDFATILAAFDD